MVYPWGGRVLCHSSPSWVLFPSVHVPADDSRVPPTLPETGSLSSGSPASSSIGLGGPGSDFTFAGIQNTWREPRDGLFAFVHLCGQGERVKVLPSRDASSWSAGTTEREGARTGGLLALAEPRSHRSSQSEAPGQAEGTIMQGPAGPAFCMGNE